MSKPLILIACYAASYGGNFIRSMRALADAYDGDVSFLLPEKARGMKWLDELGEYETGFTPFDRKGLRNACVALARKYGNYAIVHTHFVGGLSLREVTQVFPNVLCHWHMALDAPIGLKSKTISLVKKAVFNTFYSKARFIAVSEPVASAIRREYPKVRVECVPNAIDFSRYADCGLEVHGRPAFPIRALIFGSHFERKGVDIAMDACAKLLQRKAGGCILTVPTHNPSECVKKVVAIRGEVPSWLHIVTVVEDVASLYSSTDLFLSPSRSEAFGYAVVEAAYMGCGVVASDVPGQNSLKGIKDIQWVRADDPDELAEAMLASVDMITSRTQDELDALRVDLEAQYGIDCWVGRMLEIYKTVG